MLPSPVLASRRRLLSAPPAVATGAACPMLPADELLSPTIARRRHGGRQRAGGRGRRAFQIERLSLNLLGTPEVRLDGVPSRSRRARRRRSSLPGARTVPSPRARIAALLWPESDEERSRGALRSTLGILRQTLREAGRPTRACWWASATGSGWSPAADCESDLRVVRAAFDLARRTASAPEPAHRRATPGGGRGAIAATSWPASRSATRPTSTIGPPISAHSGTAGPIWSSHRLSQAAARGRRSGAAARVIAARWIAARPARRGGPPPPDADSASRPATARRALRPTSTAARSWRRNSGRRRRRRPTALAERVRRESPPPSARRPGSSPAGRRPGHRSAADRQAWPSTRRWWRRFAAARHAVAPSLVTVEGEPGIGKTRLVGDFLRWARGAGGRHPPGARLRGGRLSYQPLIDALRARLRARPAPEPLLGPVLAGRTAPPPPGTARAPPDLPAARSSSEAEGRGRLFEAVARFGQALAGRAHGGPPG